jgi:hypothetical protein
MTYYTPPDDKGGTVFDPNDKTFGPIMAAIQRGDFRPAAEMLEVLAARDDDRFDPSTLEDAARFEQRVQVGLQAIDLGDGEDPETDASDVISDVLTALYGPAGMRKPSGGFLYRKDEWGAAEALLDRAFHSWQGDAEDYYLKEES